MSHIVVLGGGIGGVSVRLRAEGTRCPEEDRVTLVSNKPFFQFGQAIRSLGCGEDGAGRTILSLTLRQSCRGHGVGFSAAGTSARPYRTRNRIELGDGPSSIQLRLSGRSLPGLNSPSTKIGAFSPSSNTKSICDVRSCGSGHNQKLGGIVQKIPARSSSAPTGRFLLFGPAYEFSP